MNSKRRAELQRKLSMGAVPRPPADLADRIKADIPQYLTATEADRNRFTMSVAFSMRIAASILLLITTAFVTLRVLENEPEQTAALAPRPKLVPAIARYDTSTSTAQQERQPAADEVRLEISDAGIPASVPAPPPPPPAAQVHQPLLVARAGAERDDDVATSVVSGVEGGVVGGVVGGTFAAEIPARERTEEVASLAESAEPEARKSSVADLPAGRAVARNAVAQAAPAPPSAPVPPPAVSERITVTASAPSIISEAHADTIDLEQKSEVFGISVDAKAFDDVKNALQKGARPAASAINVDALVNYFAGPPSRAPRRVSLEVEVSPAPVEAEGDQAVLRFTIDTPRVELRPRESTPPVATDARIDIEIDSKAVASFRRIGTNALLGNESTLLNNLSVTGLYQLDLRPGLKGSQRVATVRLRYRSVTDGQPHEITRIVRGSDLARDWAKASRRHRLASLGAVWSESLKGAGTQIEVAKRAEELATQEPRDSRARELANAATATAGGGKR